MFIQIGLISEYIDPFSGRLRNLSEREFLQHWKTGPFYHPKKYHNDFVRILDGDHSVIYSFDLKPPTPASMALSLLQQGQSLAVRSTWSEVRKLREEALFKIWDHETVPGILLLIQSRSVERKGG